MKEIFCLVVGLCVIAWVISPLVECVQQMREVQKIDSEAELFAQQAAARNLAEFGETFAPVR